jgi:short-subunit dehydrogenase
MTTPRSLKGRSALLTGATGGIGNAIARALAERGATVILTGRRASILEELAAEIGGEALAVDLTDRPSVDRLVERAGQVDILVANAALPGSGEITGFSPEEIDRALDVNLRAPIMLGRAAAVGMSKRHRGNIVFINSLSGKVSAGGSSLYSATKFGLRGFALGLREDLRPRGVGVSLVYPGFIRDAGMFAESGASLPKGVGTKRPEDVAAAVIRAIERNKAETDVAPVGLRLGTYIGMVAPGPAMAMSRRMGAAEVAASLTEGQRSKR